METSRPAGASIVSQRRSFNELRTPIAANWRVCDDTLFYRAVAEACIYWALSLHTWMRPLEKMLAQDRHLVALTDR